MLTFGLGQELKHRVWAGSLGCCGEEGVEYWDWVLLTFGLGKQVKTLNLVLVLRLRWGGSCGVMVLGVVEVWVGETNKNTEFGLGPWTAVGRNMLSQRGLLVFY